MWKLWKEEAPAPLVGLLSGLVLAVAFPPFLWLFWKWMDFWFK